MQERKYIFGLSSITLVIILGATIKFALHLYLASGYSFFRDELYHVVSGHLTYYLWGPGYS